MLIGGQQPPSRITWLAQAKQHAAKGRFVGHERFHIPTRQSYTGTRTMFQPCPGQRELVEHAISLSGLP